MARKVRRKKTATSVLLDDRRTVAAINRERIRRGQLTLASVARVLIHERIADIEAAARGSKLALDRAYADGAGHQDGDGHSTSGTGGNGTCDGAGQSPGATPPLARTGPIPRPASIPGKPGGRERAGGAKRRTRATREREAPG